MRLIKTGRSDSYGSAARAAAVRTAVHLMPEDGDLDELAVRLSQERGRPLRIIRQAMPPGAASGLWISTRSTDYVIIDAKASPTRASAILCHEFAHMILGHKGWALDESQLAMALAPEVAPQVAARFLARESYGGNQEHDAEEVGTLVAAEHTRRVRSRQQSSGTFAERLR